MAPGGQAAAGRSLGGGAEEPVVASSVLIPHLVPSPLTIGAGGGPPWPAQPRAMFTVRGSDDPAIQPHSPKAATGPVSTHKAFR